MKSVLMEVSQSRCSTVTYLRFYTDFIIQCWWKKKRGNRVLHNSIHVIDPLKQNEKRQEGDGGQMTEAAFYELLPASKVNDVENGDEGQELYTTLGDIYTDKATIESEANGEAYQELVASESCYENPGDVTSSPCSHDNIYENILPTGQERKMTVLHVL